MSLMKTLRDNIKIVFIIVIAGFLVSVFAGLGSYFFVASKNAVAIVNGEKIDREEYDYYFNNLLYQQQEAIKADPSKSVDSKEVKQEALRAVIQNKVFLQEAKKIGETVSDNEIRNLLMQYPIFQVNGKFDSNTYYKNVRYMVRKTPKEFEKLTGLNIKVEKVRFLVASATKFSKNELEFEYETFHGAVPELDKDSFSKNYAENKKMFLLNEWFKNIISQSKTEVLLKD